MNCPQCKSSHNKKNGFRRGKQSYRCKDCGCQYVKNPKPRAYSNEVKQLCLKMYVNGMGFKAIASGYISTDTEDWSGLEEIGIPEGINNNIEQIKTEFIANPDLIY